MTRTAAVVLIFLAAALLRAAPPDTPKKPVTDTYHGVSVTDDYRWLEDWNDTAVQKWSEAQNAHARSVLDKLPGVEVLREKLTKIIMAKRPTHARLAVPDGRRL